jgi:hypothetical protein
MKENLDAVVDVGRGKFGIGIFVGPSNFYLYNISMSILAFHIS